MNKRYGEVSEITVKDVLEHTPISYQKVMFNSEVIMDWCQDSESDSYGDTLFDDTDKYLDKAVTSWHVVVDSFHHGTVYLTGYEMSKKQKKDHDWLCEQDEKFYRETGAERPRGFRQLPRKK